MQQNREIRTKEYMIDECKKLIDQIIMAEQKGFKNAAESDSKE